MIGLSVAKYRLARLHCSQDCSAKVSRATAKAPFDHQFQHKYLPVAEFHTAKPTHTTYSSYVYYNREHLPPQIVEFTLKAVILH